MSTPVDRLYGESKAVVDALGSGELSLKVSASDNFRKTLVLAAASFFEYRICLAVMEFVNEQSGGSPLIVAFVKNKAIARQYHTWFKWDDTNANQFFGLFGPQFKQLMQDEVKASENLKSSIKDFLEVGNERNKLVHQDFASYSLEKTMEEIYASYKNANIFVDQLPHFLRRIQQNG